MGDFEITRSTVVNATSETLHSLVNDFHEWVQWSPWEEVDPQLQRRYSGSESGEGARYDWSGNKKAGQGTMEITADTGLEKAERFLSMSFHGGTDLVPCLEQALTQLEQPAFAKADVLVISDFIAQSLPHALLDRMNGRRAQQTRFHAVAMSRHAKSAILRVFDNSWLLDCGLRGRLLRRWQRS